MYECMNDDCISKYCICSSIQLNEVYKQIPGAQKVQKTSFRYDVFTYRMSLNRPVFALHAGVVIVKCVFSSYSRNQNKNGNEMSGVSLIITCFGSYRMQRNAGKR